MHNCRWVAVRTQVAELAKALVLSCPSSTRWGVATGGITDMEAAPHPPRSSQTGRHNQIRPAVQVNFHMHVTTLPAMSTGAASTALLLHSRVLSMVGHLLPYLSGANWDPVQVVNVDIACTAIVSMTLNINLSSLILDPPPKPPIPHCLWAHRGGLSQPTSSTQPCTQAHTTHAPFSCSCSASACRATEGRRYTQRPRACCWPSCCI